MSDDLKIRMPEWARNMYNRLLAKIDAGGGGGGGGVTGVKGNAENAYRKGNVNLTPANIGAVAKSGDTMTGTLTAPAFSGPLTGNVTGNCSGSSGSCTGNAATATKATQDGDGNNIASTYLPKALTALVGNFDAPGASIIQLRNDSSGTNPSSVLDGNQWLILTDVYGNDSYSGQLAIGFQTGIAWRGKSGTTTWGSWKKIAFADDTVAVAHGGTGATTPEGARVSLGLNDIGTTQAQSVITPVNDDQLRQIYVTTDCWVCASFHVTANVDGCAVMSRNGVPVINNVHSNGACNYWANAQFPCRAGGLLQYRLNSNATDSSIYFLTV